MKYTKRHICFNKTGIVIPVIILSVILLSCPLFAQDIIDKPVYLKYLSGQTTFYTGQEYTLLLDKGDNFWESADSLNIRISYANKVILERNSSAEFPVKFQFKYPKLRPGVVADAVLTVSAYYKGKMQKGIYQKKLYFYSKEVDGQSLLKKEELGVLDQTENSDLIKFMDDQRILYSRIHSLSGFKGKWVICAGLNFEIGAGLFDELYSMVSSGVSMLVLPPIKGNFIISSYKKNTESSFSDEIRIKDFDKRFNLMTIGSGGKQSKTVFQYEVKNNVMNIEFEPLANGYSWFEFEDENARLIVLGWDLIKLSETNPTANRLIYSILNKIK